LIPANTPEYWQNILTTQQSLSARCRSKLDLKPMFFDHPEKDVEFSPNFTKPMR
jgi:hypothetical protein